MRSAMAMTVRSADAFAGWHRKRTKAMPSRVSTALNVVVVCVEREDLLGLRAALLLDDGLEQLLLALEIDVERALGDAGLARDLAHAGGIEALGQEHRPRALDDLAPLGAVLADGASTGGRRVCVIPAFPVGLNWLQSDRTVRSVLT